jgi:hypothetical protein
MLDTINNLYLVNTSLFKGLYIEKHLNDPLFQRHPVISLDLSSIPSTEGLSGVKENLLGLLQLRAEDNKIQFFSKSTVFAFGELIERLGKRDGKVVILIDEYDRLLIDTFDEPELQNSFRDLFRDFFYQIKAQELFIHIVYITGISNHTKMNLSSAASNIKDFSNQEDFSTMFGYTHKEIKENFYRLYP